MSRYVSFPPGISNCTFTFTILHCERLFHLNNYSKLALRMRNVSCCSCKPTKHLKIIFRYKNGKELKPSKKIRISATGKEVKLTVEGLCKEDAGTIRLVATDDNDEVSSDAVLRISQAGRCLHVHKGKETKIPCVWFQQKI